MQVAGLKSLNRRLGNHYWSNTILPPTPPTLQKNKIVSLKKWLWLYFVRTSVSDPDPDWIRIESGQLIRIRIQEGKNEKMTYKNRIAVSSLF
jgi:hypothetical protein